MDRMKVELTFSVPTEIFVLCRIYNKLVGP